MFILLLSLCSETQRPHNTVKTAGGAAAGGHRRKWKWTEAQRNNDAAVWVILSSAIYTIVSHDGGDNVLVPAAAVQTTADQAAPMLTTALLEPTLPTLVPPSGSGRDISEVA